MDGTPGVPPRGETVTTDIASAPLRIAFFSEVYWPMVSGVAITLQRAVEALQARGHSVRVYTASYPLDDGVPDRPEVHRSPSRSFFLYPDMQWAFPRHRELVRDATAFRPDVIHAATEFAVGVAGIRVAKALGVPAVASAHTHYDEYAARYRLHWALGPGWRYLRWFYGRTERVLCPSRVYEEHLRRRGVPHTALWTRGVDASAFAPAFRSDAYRRAVGVGPDDLLVTYVGRLAPEKNLDLLLDAWPAIAGRHAGARLALVGGGPRADALARRRVPGVRMMGELGGAELSSAYASADIFAFPSTSETFGNVLLEAMASGVAPVVAASGGVLDFSRHGENAWLVEPNSRDALAEGIGRLAGDPALRARLGAGAVRTAVARRWDVIHDGLAELYREVAGKGRLVRAA